MGTGQGCLKPAMSIHLWVVMEEMTSQLICKRGGRTVGGERPCREGQRGLVSTDVEHFKA